MACYGYEGIDAVKEALRAGLNCSTETMPIKVSTQFFPSQLNPPKPNEIFMFHSKCEKWLLVIFLKDIYNYVQFFCCSYWYCQYMETPIGI